MAKCTKKIQTFCEVCAHLLWTWCYNQYCKTPPNTLYSFCYTHKKTKYLLLKDSFVAAVFFTV